MESAIFIIVVWIFSVCLHEFGHAFTAYLGGDTTVKDRGYLTLNPVAYFNSATTLVLPIIFLLLGGIPLPGAAVYINTARIRSTFMISLTSLAGPFATFLVMVVLMMAYRVFSSDSMSASFPPNVVEILKPSLALLVYLHAFVLILNLIPLPPLDGWGIIEPWMPENIQIAARRNGNLGFLVIMGLMWMYPPASALIRGWSYEIAGMVNIGKNEVSDALVNFQEYSIPLLALIIVTFVVKNIKTPEQKAKEAAAASAAASAEAGTEAGAKSSDTASGSKTEI